MKFVPPVIGVVYPRPIHRQVLAYQRSWEMPSIAGHELDYKRAALHRAVHTVEQKAVGGIEREIEMQVAILLVAHRNHAPGNTLAGGQHREPIRVINPAQDITRRVTRDGTHDWLGTARPSTSRNSGMMRPPAVVDV